MEVSSRKQLGYLLLIFGVVLALVLGFVKISYDAQAAQLCQLTPQDQMAQCPVHTDNSSWLFMAGFAIAAVLVVVGAYFAFFEKREQDPRLEIAKKAFKEVDVSKLSEEEGKVYTLLKNASGSLFQSDLVRETGYSKVKLSRILDRLEQLELAERKRRGMANLVVLR
ncbi:MAG: hypothetical protein V1847_03800 [Candidatus Diapherotrites archaeon]